MNIPETSAQRPASEEQLRLICRLSERYDKQPAGTYSVSDVAPFTVAQASAKIDALKAKLAERQRKFDERGMRSDHGTNRRKFNDVHRASEG